MQAVRVAVFITFVYYAITYLLNASKEMYPIHFFKIFIISLGITAIIFTYQYEESIDNYVIGIFFIICGIIFHLASKPNIRKYFS